MCDYCDCRSHPVIASLSQDHALVLGLLGELRRAADLDDGESATVVVGRLHDVLAEHEDTEERVFAQLRATDVDTEYVGRYEHDHNRINALLHECGTVGWQHAARDLVALLGAHIDREETDLFPAAHQLLTPVQWEEIGQPGIDTDTTTGALP